MNLKNVQPRIYQERIFAKAVNSNTLVVLPTGLGKTLISIMLSIHRLKSFPDSRVLILAPTKPLADQHLNSFTEKTDLNKDELILLTGAIPPEKRIQSYSKARVVFATPQTIENDLLSGRIELNDFCLIVFDEAHRAVQNYSYCFLARQYVKQALNPRVLAMTASPGSDKEKIIEVCRNLLITNVESRSETDEDVKEYIEKKDIKKIYLDLPEELESVLKYLRGSYSKSLKELKNQGLISTSDSLKVFKKELLGLQKRIQTRLFNGEKTPEVFMGLSSNAKAIKLMYSLDLIQTQGVKPLIAYFDKLKKNQSRASRELFQDHDFREAMRIAYSLKTEHPKFGKLIELLKSEPPNNSFLIFTQYRETGKRIVEELDKNNITARLFIGQQGIGGMSQKRQLKVLGQFRNQEFSALVSTSISEEGIDVPSIDTAIFFEPVPSALRSVQRRGRVGRAKTGKIYVLITKGTIDERYHWMSYYKERRMKNSIKEIRNEDLTQSSLADF